MNTSLKNDLGLIQSLLLHGALFTTLILTLSVAMVFLQPGDKGTWEPLDSGRFLFAQGASGKIVGKVVDQDSNGIPGVTVLVVGTTRGASTDPDGRYLIIGIPAGIYTLRFSMVGYQAKETTLVAVEAYKETRIDAKLDSCAIELKACYVTEHKTDYPAVSTSSCSVVTGGRVTVEPNVKTLSSVIRSSKGFVKRGSNLFLHGGRSNGVQYIVDGVPVSNTTANTGTLTGSSTNSALTQYAAGGVARAANISNGESVSGAYADLNREGYDRIYENDFKDALANPLSTFSIDVDAASYANVRRYITFKQLPPPDAVRIEEMVNYFSYDYDSPKDNVPFSITTELAQCPWNHADKLLLIGLQAKKIATAHLPASNLVFLIDVSGSMDEEDKLPLVKSAFRLLVQQLREQDHVAIVVYAGNAGLVLPSTPGSHKQAILEAIDRLEAGGSTAGGAGINLAYQVAKENFLEHGNNRVILATDGDFNVGASSDADLVRLIEEKRKTGIYLSVLGFGTGNYQDAKMQQLADKGNGNHSYIDNILEAKKVFVGQMAGTLFTIAKDVKIQIEFNPAKVKAYRLIGYENRLLAKEDFNDDKKDAGELGAGHTVTAMYEVVPVDGKIELATVDSLRYQQTRLSAGAQWTNEMMTVKLRYKLPEDTVSNLIVHRVRDEKGSSAKPSNNVLFASSVAEFGMLLRGSKYKGDATYDDVLARAQAAKGEDTEGYRQEFIRMAETVKLMNGDNHLQSWRR